MPWRKGKKSTSRGSYLHKKAVGVGKDIFEETGRGSRSTTMGDNFWEAVRSTSRSRDETGGGFSSLENSLSRTILLDLGWDKRNARGQG